MGTNNNNTASGWKKNRGEKKLNKRRARRNDVKNIKKEKSLTK
jgi:hypothetical protein